MKLKHLIIELQKLEGFDNPKIHLEQYSTPPKIAEFIFTSAILDHIDGDVDLANCIVADLGCGTGTFLIGSVLLGAKFSIGLDIDPAALAICKRNISQQGCSTKCDLIQMDLDPNSGQIPNSLYGLFDVVVTNPPFGTKNNQGADIKFVKAALLLAKPNGGKVYSLHKTSTREYLLGKKAEKWPPEVKIEVRAQMRWNLDQTYAFHRRKNVDIDVDLLCFQRLN